MLPEPLEARPIIGRIRPKRDQVRRDASVPDRDEQRIGRRGQPGELRLIQHAHPRHTLRVDPQNRLMVVERRPTNLESHVPSLRW